MSLPLQMENFDLDKWNLLCGNKDRDGRRESLGEVCADGGGWDFVGGGVVRGGAEDTTPNENGRVTGHPSPKQRQAIAPHNKPLTVTHRDIS